MPEPDARCNGLATGSWRLCLKKCDGQRRFRQDINHEPEQIDPPFLDFVVTGRYFETQL